MLRVLSKVHYSIECEPEDIQIEGNAMASGDDAADEKANKWVRDQLNRGNQWAWCHVRVTAERNGLQGSDSLGACSYRSEKDFKRGGYWTDMKREALHNLEAAEAAAGVMVHKKRKGR